MQLARAAAVAAAVALGSFAFAPAPAAQESAAARPPEDPIDVGSLGPFNSSFLWAVNNRGDAVGWGDTAGLDTEHAILWRDGQLVDLGVLPGFAVSIAYGINDRGQIVGASGEHGSGRFRAVVWQDGQIVDITPPASDCAARAINKRGEIAGGCNGIATLWRDGEIVSLPPPSGFTGSSAVAMNDAGMVAGILDDRTTRFRSFQWVDGTMTLLEVPPGFDTAFATAINARGDVVGYVGPSAGIDMLEPVVWREGKVTPLSGTWGTFHGIAWGINDHGEVVGAGHDAAHLPDQPGGAFVWSRGQFRFLPPGSNAQDINEHGVAVGRFFFHESGILHGMVWPRAATRPRHGGGK
jgi:probable HAF family extracellular repeat protein